MQSLIERLFCCDPKEGEFEAAAPQRSLGQLSVCRIVFQQQDPVRVLVL
ncbi:MAG TPA: hypothetical protein VKT26_05330 [Acetobacteraceae bacterium]|nr:hypothetical protein [Acetobacteraceae bacterium]